MAPLYVNLVIAPEREATHSAAGERGTSNTTWFIRKPKTLGVFGGWAYGSRFSSGEACVCACVRTRGYAVTGVWV